MSDLEVIYNNEDLYNMLDSLLRKEGDWWNSFYSDRQKDIPFFKNAPDENLVSYFERNLLKPGKVLELGCGPGRNSIYFSLHGCPVDGVDISEEAIKWARERTEDRGYDITFHCKSIFEFDYIPCSYDIVYDCGCFHHIAPHRRMSYIQLILNALKPDGKFCIICFNEEGGSDISDWEVYRQKSMKGGLGFSEEKFRTIFEKDFIIKEFRQMKDITSEDLFGVPYVWTSLMEKREDHEKISGFIL
jgi:SAM-dependent methyltransferase